MISKSIKTVLLCSLVLFASCKKDEKTTNENSQDTTMSDNILLQEWTGPYQGVPAFDKMDVADIKDAILTGIDLSLEDIDAIANSTEPATFENTIEAMEASGEELNRVYSYYGILSLPSYSLHLLRPGDGELLSWPLFDGLCPQMAYQMILLCRECNDG